jgi:lipoate-protein ligase A
MNLPQAHPEPETWLLLHSGAGAPAWNMAVDEALLLACERLGRPVLRFYGWTEPAATFGYFQPIADVEAMTGLRPLIRRTTGGGLVPHEADWTYSLAFPPAHRWYSWRAEESYRRLHEWVRDAFVALGAAVELAPCCAKELPGQCFAGPEKFDLVWSGHKIAGAAQRRSLQGLLIQGSIQRQPPGVARGDWERGFADAARGLHGVEWASLEWTPQLEDAARGLERMKYSRDEHNRKR